MVVEGEHFKDYLDSLVLSNGGVLDGVRILSKNSVESFFSNQLPEGMTLKHPLVEAFNNPMILLSELFLMKKIHSYAWTIESIQTNVASDLKA